MVIFIVSSGLKKALKIQQILSQDTVRVNGYTNLRHSHLKVLLVDMNSPFSQSIHPCLCANTLKNKDTRQLKTDLLYITFIHPASTIQRTNSHLNFSTRGSRHQLCNLPQINATRQVHLPGVDLQDVQTGLLVQNKDKLKQTKKAQHVQVCVFTAQVTTSSFGGGNSIFLSILPGLSRAESRMSIRLVAMMT